MLGVSWRDLSIMLGLMGYSRGTDEYSKILRTAKTGYANLVSSAGH